MHSQESLLRTLRPPSQIREYRRVGREKGHRSRGACLSLASPLQVFPLAEGQERRTGGNDSRKVFLRIGDAQGGPLLGWELPLSELVAQPVSQKSKAVRI